MAQLTTFSVGIPTFNQADFLEETILSLLNQSRPPDEIVISDHYSTDHTPDIIAKFAKQVRPVKPPPDVNLAGQYNFTLLSQTCDWITMLSSDDIARPNFCEVLIRGASRTEDAALVRAGWEQIDDSGKVLGQHYMLSVPRIEPSPANLISQKNGPKVGFSSFAIRRDAFVKSGPIPVSFESLADWALFVQLAPFGCYVYEDEIISGYRVGHDGNKFRNRMGMWVRDEQRMFDEVFPLAAERAGVTERAWIAEANQANFLRYLTAASEEFSPSERREIVKDLQSWAVKVDSVAILQDFAVGKNISAPVSLTERAKNIIRPFAQRLYGLRGRL
jgi:glycosyltransferase involved in cell wall biosynthesis